jgi:hypothetical protein
MSIKRLRFEDIIKEAESEAEADDAVSRFDLDFSLMALELATFLPNLLEVLGGEDLPEGTSAEPPGTPVTRQQTDSEPVTAEVVPA